MVNIFSAAKYVCDRSGWSLSNLELQKILYVAHMVYMGRNGERLLSAQFQAWDYGPVSPSLYHKAKAFGSKPIPNIFKHIEFPESKAMEVLKEAHDNLRHLTPGQLVALTHAENGAWAKNYIPGHKGVAISDEDILDEYRERFQTGKPG